MIRPMADHNVRTAADVAAVATCIACSCTDLEACEPFGCYWLRVDRHLKVGVCSECPEAVPAWERGERRVRV